jgi:peptidoglycan/xylan/chitin deacetylase (PgdA/CDA1 family)
MKVAAAASLAVTFDDGHRSQLEQGLPILERHGIAAVFFITTGWTAKRQGYMDWDDLRALAAAGHRVEAHGWTHRFFSDCGARELDDELRRPKMEIEDRLGRPVTALSFPGGRFNSRVLAACAEAGYRHVYTSDPWPAQRQAGELCVTGRFGVTRQTSQSFLQVLAANGGRPPWGFRIKHGAKQSLRRLLGDNGYHRLWCLVSGGDRDPQDAREPK